MSCTVENESQAACRLQTFMVLEGMLWRSEDNHREMSEATQWIAGLTLIFESVSSHAIKTAVMWPVDAWGSQARHGHYHTMMAHMWKSPGRPTGLLSMTTLLTHGLRRSLPEQCLDLRFY